MARHAVKADRLQLRRETGVRTFADLPLERAQNVKKEFFPSGSSLTSIRPVLMLTGDLPAEDIRARVRAFVGAGRDVMTARLDAHVDAEMLSLRARTEDALALARDLAHRCAGKTVEVWAQGEDVAPAALMMALERPYFSTLTAVNPPPARLGWPSWEELAK